MFEKFRKSLKSKPKNSESGIKLKSIVAYVIFGAIILVFALFGITPDRMGSDLGGNAAIVNGHSISVGNFRRRLDLVERSTNLNLDQFPPAQREMFAAELRRRTLEDLIMGEGLFQKAEKLGLKVSDEEVRRTITSIDAFKEEGQFKRQNYEGYLTSTGQDAASFEREIRKELMAQKLRNLFAFSHQISMETKDGLDSLNQVSLTFDFATFSPSNLREKISLSKAQVDEALAKDLGAIRANFEQRKFEFAEEEQVKARHILVRTDKDPSGADKKVEEIKSELTAKNFAEMAKKWSEDPGSKEKGGELGFFGKGRMDPDFENAAFSLPIGQISEPVKSQFGYHFILVEEKKEGGEPSFEEVKETVARQYVARRRVDEKLESLKSHLQSGDLNSARADLKALGVSWETAKDVKLGADQIPGLSQTAEAMKLLAARRGQLGLLPELMEWSGEYHLFDLKDWNSVAAEKGQSQGSGDAYSERLASESFQKWAVSVRDDLKVERNTRLMR